MPLYKAKQLILVDREKVNMKEGTIANATMELFHLWTTYTDEMREYIVFHELAHNISSLYQINNTHYWQQLSGWEKRENGWELDYPERVVSEYATVSHSEDFAESLSAYRYNPEYLKKIDPRKYEFIKTAVFFGVEYLEEKNCNKASEFKKIDSEFNSFTVTKDIVNLAFDNGACKIEHFRYLFGEKDLSNELDSCIANYYSQKRYRDTNPGRAFLHENNQNYKKFQSFKITHHFGAYDSQNKKIRNELSSLSMKIFNKVTPELIKLGPGGCTPMFYSVDKDIEAYIRDMYKYEYAGYLNKGMIQFCRENFKTLESNREVFLQNFLDSRPRKNL